MVNIQNVSAIPNQMNRIDTILKENTPEQAMVLLSKIIAENPQDAAALFARGKLYWKEGNRAKATSDYAAAAAIDPDSPAVMALEQAREIENFFNPDLLNP